MHLPVKLTVIKHVNGLNISSHKNILERMNAEYCAHEMIVVNTVSSKVSTSSPQFSSVRSFRQSAVFVSPQFSSLRNFRHCGIFVSPSFYVSHLLNFINVEAPYLTAKGDKVCAHEECWFKHPLSKKNERRHF